MVKRYVLSITLMLCCIVIGFSMSTNAISADSYFSNEKWGLKFTVPAGVNVYTSENPGPMASRINSDTPLWLVSSSLASERINLKVSQFQDGTEKELDKTKQELDSGNLYRSVPQYQKISVKCLLRLANKQTRTLLSTYTHSSKENLKLRQIMFVHRGRVFNFTCATSPERFDIANSQFFDTIFSSMEFK